MTSRPTDEYPHMKWLCVIALLLITADCVEKALGTEPQMLFVSERVWLWWFPAAWWFVAAIGMSFSKVSR